MTAVDINNSISWWRPGRIKSPEDIQYETTVYIRVKLFESQCVIETWRMSVFYCFLYVMKSTYIIHIHHK